ncbi:MAG: hypothetical protein J6M53_06985 [Bacteroidaceae bacterium]|nr:hypothetical protein [Bacteroidaceae bacterium]
MKAKTLLLSLLMLLGALPSLADVSFDSSKKYTLQHVYSGKYLFLAESYTETGTVNATSLREIGTVFTIAASGSGWTFTKADNTDYSIGRSSTSWNTSNTGKAVWTVAEVTVGGETLYTITNPDNDNKYLAPNLPQEDQSGYIYCNKTGDAQYMYWRIVEYDENNIDVSKTYAIRHVSSQLYLTLNTEASGGFQDPVSAAVVQPWPMRFTLTKSGDGYTITPDGGTHYLGAQTSPNSWCANNSTQTAWLISGTGEGSYYIQKDGTYYLSPNDAAAAAGSYVYTDKWTDTQIANAKWELVEADLVTTITALPGLPTNLTAEPVYTLSTPGRGSVLCTSGGTTLQGNKATSNTVTFDASDTRFQFAFIKGLLGTYLYNVGTGLFARNAEGSSSTISVSSTPNADGLVTLLASTNGTYATTYPSVLQVGDYQINLSTGGTGVYSWNSTGDEGNCLQIGIAGTADLTAAYAAVQAYEQQYIADTQLALSATVGYPHESSTPYANLEAAAAAWGSGTPTLAKINAVNAAITAFHTSAISDRTMPSSSKTYVVEAWDTGRGAWYYNSSAPTVDGAIYMADTKKYGDTTTDIAVSTSDPNQQFAFIYSQNWYIYNVGSQRFVTEYGSDNARRAVLATDITDASRATFKASAENPSKQGSPWVVQVNGDDIGLSNGSSYTNPAIMFWPSNNDGGNCVHFIEAGTLDKENEWVAYNAIYKYEGNAELNYTINYVGAPSDAAKSVTFLDVNFTTGITTYYPAALITSALNGGKGITPVSVEGYSVEVTLDGTAITVTYTATEKVAVTYIYKYGDTEWLREENEVTPGSKYPDLHAKPSGVVYDFPEKLISGTVGSAEEVTITCTLTPNYQIVPSASYATAKWFYLSMRDGDNKYLYATRTTNTNLTLNQTSVSSNTTTKKQYQWAFVGNPFIGYKIYNNSAGSDYILTSVALTGDGGTTYPHMEMEAGLSSDYNTHWTITEDGLGGLLARKGESNYMSNYGGGTTLAFWTSTDVGSRICFSPVEASLAATTSLKDNAGTTWSTSKTYRLVNRKTGRALVATSASALGTAALDNTSSAQQWTITKPSNSYSYLRAKNSGYSCYINSISLTSAGASTSNSNIYFFPSSTGADGVQYYRISTSSSLPTSGNTRTFLADNGSTAIGWSYDGTGTEWYLEEFTPSSAQTKTYATSITSGNYYRLINNYRDGSRTMVDVYGTVSTGAYDEESYSQVWQIIKSGDNYRFRNAMTGQYIQDTRTGASQDWTTATSTSSINFALGGTSTNSAGQTTFAFVSTTGAYLNYGSGVKRWGFHCDGSNAVVSWEWDAGANYWILENVTLTDEEKAQIAELQSSTDYTSTLATFFDDAACTQLKSEYASKTDAQLRSAMSALPTMLQEMGVHVKNDTWNSNAVWNHYEKDFRIHDYDVFSEPGVWSSKLQFGSFSRLHQPTGIRLKSNEYAYLLVDADVADSDGHLYAELVSDLGLAGSQIALHRGCNKILAGADCEIFITYNCTNTDKALSTYPDIKIQIAGGTCNGTFDMRRGHTNNDWLWLTNNMFSDTYLHIKSNHTLFNTYLDRVKDTENITGVLNIWDYVFVTEENLMTTRFYDGYYKPVMIVSDYASDGYDNWSALIGGAYGRVSMQNSHITSNGVFNYNALLYSGTEGGQQWVIEHEEGHGHQNPYNYTGGTESSNNGLAQIVNHIWGYRTSRGAAIRYLIDYFNKGYTWVDYMRAYNSGGSFYDKEDSDLAIWLTNKIIYQLWLYFHLKDDDGFFPRFVSKMVELGGIVKGTTTSSPSYYYNDYLRLARAATLASETDLYEFFKAWGFFAYADEIKKSGLSFTDDYNIDFADVPASGLYCLNDYRGYYIKMPIRGDSDDEARLTDLINLMHSQPNKAPGILFINDTGELLEITAENECTKYDPTLIGTTKQYANTAAQYGAGSTGTYNTFNGKNEADNLSYAVSGTTVSVTGSGAVGYKIYDANGDLVWLACTNEFTVSSAIATGLGNGTYTLVASLGNDKDLILSNTGKYYATLNIYRSASDVTTYNTSGKQPSDYTSLSGVLGTNATKGTLLGDFDDSDVQPGVNNVVATINVSNSGVWANRENYIYRYTDASGDDSYNTAWKMVITDKVNFFIPTPANVPVKAQNVVYGRSGKSAGYNSVCLPFAFSKADFTDLGYDVTVYELTGRDGGTMKFTSTEAEIPAGTPVIIKDNVTAWDFTLNNVNRKMCGTPVDAIGSQATLHGSFTGGTIGTGYYKLNGAGTKFQSTTAASTITPFRVYLEATGAAVRQFTVMFEEGEAVTAIGTLDADGNLTAAPADQIFDLQGRRVTQPQRGHIYIVGGKKVKF